MPRPAPAAGPGNDAGRGGGRRRSQRHGRDLFAASRLRV